MSFSSFLLRTMFGRGDKKRDAGLVTPEDVVRYDSIAYGSDPKWNLLDVYRPKAETGKLPVIVSVHGGGWVYGTKEVYQFYCMSLAQHGFAVVNFNYRLAPEHKFPAGLEDTNRVFAWILDHAGEYGLDPEQIFAVGDSAGAHMLSLYSCICSNKKYAKTYSFAVPKKLTLRGVALNCGVYEVKPDEKGMTPGLMKDLLPHKGTAQELHHISPIHYITPDFPPAFVMAAAGDELTGVPQDLLSKLEGCGVKHTYHFYGDDAHRIGHVFHCNIRLPEAKSCNDDQCAWFHAIMAQEETAAL